MPGEVESCCSGLSPWCIYNPISRPLLSYTLKIWAKNRFICPLSKCLSLTDIILILDSCLSFTDSHMLAWLFDFAILLQIWWCQEYRCVRIDIAMAVSRWTRACWFCNRCHVTNSHAV
jgi:hypothetical protein